MVNEYESFQLSSCVDLRQELAVRERTTERMSAPSSPTLDIDKMDSAVQASLSLPATPVGKSIEHTFPKGRGFNPLFFLKYVIVNSVIWVLTLICVLQR